MVSNRMIKQNIKTQLIISGDGIGGPQVSEAPFGATSLIRDVNTRFLPLISDADSTLMLALSRDNLPYGHFTNKQPRNNQQTTTSQQKNYNKS